MPHPKSRGLSLRSPLWLAGAVALVSSCASVVVTDRIADAPKPASPPVRVDLGAAIFEDHIDVTQSPRQRDLKVNKVVIYFPEGGAEIQARGEIERQIRKSLIKRGIDVVVSEVRAKVEANQDLRGRKEALTSVEKLIVLGRDTGAEAMLVFDEVRTDDYVYDARFTWSRAANAYVAAATPAGRVPPACPNGFRFRVPAVSAKGRFINMANATIVAEFDVNVMALRDRDQLKQPVTVERFAMRPVNKQSAYSVDDGCSRRHHMYQYVAGWQATEVLCSNLQQVVARHLPPPGDAWRHTEAGVDVAMGRILSTAVKH